MEGRVFDVAEHLPESDGPVRAWSRGRIEGWSHHSRLRFRMHVEATPFEVWRGQLFVTLTYPGEWSRDGRVWKRHLAAFLKSWRRVWDPHVRAVWKVEFQGRGAPHFHLWIESPPDVVFAAECGPSEYYQMVGRLRAWVSQRWYEVVGSGDPKHLAAGTNVRRSGPNHASNYIKAYLVKYADHVQNQFPDDCHDIGRVWGYVGYKLQHQTVVITRDQALMIRRTGRRLVQSRQRAAGRRASFRGGAILWGPSALRIVEWVVGVEDTS